MNYERFCDVLNKQIFEGERTELLKKIADHPERFIGLFRPTKPGAKLFQNLLQSHEIRFGDAIEELFRVLFVEMGFRQLEPRVYTTEGETLDIDHYFTDEETFYLVEQKVRDDHDSTKKKGQMDNFEEKLGILYDKHGTQLVGILYFIDPDFHKNEAYYRKRLNDLKVMKRWISGCSMVRGFSTTLVIRGCGMICLNNYDGGKMNSPIYLNSTSIEMLRWR